MAGFIFALIFCVVIIGAIAGLFIAQSSGGKLGSVCVVVVAAIIAGICFFESTHVEVPTRNVGVVVSYGKIVGAPLQPGFHSIAPWKTVDNIPETTTTDNYNQSTTTPHRTGTCITIRLGQGQEGCADVSITYNVSSAGVNALFLKYGASNIQEQVQNNLIYNNTRTALNNTLGDYLPIADALQAGNSGTSQFSQFDPKVLSAIRAAVGDEVTVASFDLQYVHYSSEVQQQLDGIQTKEGTLQQENEQLLINRATAAANQALVSKTGNLSTQQLQQECLTIVQKAEADNYELPATYGNCVTGTTSSTIVDTGK